MRSILCIGVNRVSFLIPSCAEPGVRDWIGVLPNNVHEGLVKRSVRVRCELEELESLKEGKGVEREEVGARDAKTISWQTLESLSRPRKLESRSGFSTKKEWGREVSRG